MRSIHEIPNRQETPMRKQKQLNLQFLLNIFHDDIGGPGSALTTTCISSILKKIRVTSLYLTPAQISFPHLSAKFDKVPRTMGQQDSLVNRHHTSFPPSFSNLVLLYT